MLKYNKNKPSLSIIVPCFNEAEGIQENINILKNKLGDLINKKIITKNKSNIVLIDDGSTDKTWEIIKRIAEADNVISGIKLSKNYGHQNALLAGLQHNNNDVTISIDADLQDDIEVIDQMIDEYLKGSEIVFGVRKDRSEDSFFKRFSANLFYKLINLFEKNMIEHHADFRLASKNAISKLSEFNEINLYLRGMFTLLTKEVSVVYFKRKKRNFGKSKYTIFKMIALAINGLTSFSLAPLRLIIFFGFCISFISFLLIIYYLTQAIIFKVTIRGWTSIVLPIYFLGGIQVLSIGIIAEYIGKIYSETKRRPRYLIDSIINLSRK